MSFIPLILPSLQMSAQFVDKNRSNLLMSKDSLDGFKVDPKTRDDCSQICGSAIFRAKPDSDQKDTIKSVDPTQGNGWADR